jgi:hypothetical protein
MLPHFEQLCVFCLLKTKTGLRMEDGPTNLLYMAIFYSGKLITILHWMVKGSMTSNRHFCKLEVDI